MPVPAHHLRVVLHPDRVRRVGRALLLGESGPSGGDGGTTTPTSTTRTRLVLLGLCVGPLACAVALLGTALAVASVVFGVQALVVGAEADALHADASQGDNEPACAHVVAVWLVVFGALSVGSCVLQNACGGVETDAATGMRRVRENAFTALGKFAGFGTFIAFLFGIHVLITQAYQDDCGSSHEFHVLRTIIYVLGWGSLAMFAAVALLGCMVCPLLSAILAASTSVSLIDVDVDVVSVPAGAASTAATADVESPLLPNPTSTSTWETTSTFGALTITASVAPDRD